MLFESPPSRPLFFFSLCSAEERECVSSWLGVGLLDKANHHEFQKLNEKMEAKSQNEREIVATHSHRN